MTHTTATTGPTHTTGTTNTTDTTRTTHTTHTTDIRPLMSAFPSGVGVVAALGADSVPRGMTCSSLASVALAPATLVVCLRSASPTLRATLDSGQFALNLLHEDARDVSDLFASGNAERFALTEWRLPLGAAGPHLTLAAHAVADCTVTRTVEVGDHTAVFGQVNRVTLAEDKYPLLYGRRRYARWSAAASAPPPAASPAEPAALPVPAVASLSGPTPLEGDSRVRS